MTLGDLTLRQHRFIEELLVVGNKTEALIRAGLSRRGASSTPANSTTNYDRLLSRE